MNGPLHAQVKQQKAPAGPETRYFTAFDGVMNGEADLVLKETRQGKTVTAATLDVCFPAEKGGQRKDRFVLPLAVSGATLSGTTKSLIDQQPVTVKLTRKATADTYEFKGQIVIGTTLIDIASADNTDLSEREFQDTQTTDDGIVTAPKDFSEVSPESIALKVRLEAATDFLKSLKGQGAELTPSSLTVSCDAVRSDVQPMYLNVDPDKAAAFLTRVRAMPGVTIAGWATGLFDMERTVRFVAADWRNGDAINRDKIAATLGDVAAKVFNAALAESKWNDTTGKLKLVFKRPSTTFAALQLTETLELTALVAPDKPGGTDKLMLWVGSPITNLIDEGSGPKLTLTDPGGGQDDEVDVRNDGALRGALAAAFKAQVWDADASAWK